jgi:hypothetical protein
MLQSRLLFRRLSEYGDKMKRTMSAMTVIPGQRSRRSIMSVALAVVLIFLVAASCQPTDDPGEVDDGPADSSGEQEEDVTEEPTAEPTATLMPTEAPTSTPEPTETPIPTDTPVPTATNTPEPTLEELVLGRWICSNCTGNKVGRTLEFVDTGSGFQHIVLKDGSPIEWIGPEECKNINVPYENCGVTFHEDDSLTVAYRLLGTGFYTDYEFDIAYRDETLIYTRAAMDNYSGDVLTQSQDILYAFEEMIYVRVDE